MSDSDDLIAPGADEREFAEAILVSSERLLEVAHVAHRLCVSEEHVRRLLREGDLPFIRIGRRHIRIDPRDLQRFIDSRRVATGRN